MTNDTPLQNNTFRLFINDSFIESKWIDQISYDKGGPSKKIAKKNYFGNNSKVIAINILTSRPPAITLTVNKIFNQATQFFTHTIKTRSGISTAKLRNHGANDEDQLELEYVIFEKLEENESQIKFRITGAQKLSQNTKIEKNNYPIDNVVAI